MSATSIDLSQIKTDALSAASTFRTLIGLGTSATFNAGSANGVATLGADSKLTAAQIPDISLISYLGSVASQAAMLALTGQQGDWCVRSDLSTTWVITGSDPTLLANWTQLSYPSVPVQSVFGRTGAVVGVSTDYSSVGITNTAIGATNPSTGAFTTLSTTGRITTPSILLSGNFSSTAWTTSGVGLSHTARTLTDTSSTGTVTTAYTNVLGGNTIAASNATTFTDYASLFIGSPSAGSNVTITNPFSLITQGAARFGGAVGINAGTLNGTVLDIAQTWGGTGTYTGIKYNVTDSGPANAASLLLDLQVGGVSKASISKGGAIQIQSVNYQDANILYFGRHTAGIPKMFGFDSYQGFRVAGGAWIAWSNSTYDSSQTLDLYLYRDASGILAQRNGTSAQALRLYKTWANNGVDYERGVLDWQTTSDVLRIGTEAGGSGTVRNIALVGGNVGIGTTNPLLKLSVEGSGQRIATYIRNTNSGGYSELVFDNDTVYDASPTGSFVFGYGGTGTAYPNNAYFWNRRNSPILFGTNNTERMRIDGAGNVGIGLTSPAAKLDISDTTGAGSGSLQASILNLAQTWNTTGTPTAFKLNVTDTASNAASLLMDLQVGGSSKFKVSKDSVVSVSGASSANDIILNANASVYGNGLESGIYFRQQPGGNRFAVGKLQSDNALAYDSWSYHLFRKANGTFLAQFGNGWGLKVETSVPIGWDSDLLLYRDAANTLALRNSTNAQTFRIYNTTDAGLTNYERAKIAWESNVLRIGTEGLGTGAVTPRSMEFQTNGTTRLTIDGSTGAVILPNSSSTSSFLLRGAAYATTGININSSGALLFSGSGAGTDLSVASNVIVHRGLQIGPSDGFTELYQAGSPSGTQTGVLEQRYTTCPQTYRIYATRSSSTNYERAKLEWATDGSVFRIGTEKGSGGGSAKPLEIQTDDTTRLTISTTGLLTLADASNLAVGTTTGTKIGTATTQKIGFYNATPVVQPAAVADATDAASVITQLNLLLARMRDLGLIAT